MLDAGPRRDEFSSILRRVTEEAERYLASVDSRPVLSSRLEKALGSFDGSLPERGVGSGKALQELIQNAPDGAATTSGPRCFHYVIGGTTPAALGADWLATLLDQMSYAWIASPLGVHLETIAIDWLKDLFRLPAEMSGIITTGATMSNFVGLACARQWWARQHGVDIAQQGFAKLPAVPVFSGGYVHASSVKTLGMMGIGRRSLTRFIRDSAGRLDVDGLRSALVKLGGQPCIVIANAGEVNAGDFDPIAEMAGLAEKHNAWLHVDGAFGLFARVSPRTESVTRGVEQAHSITVDGHKWLNVPYDCGFAFVRDGRLMAEVFAYDAAYLADPDDPKPTFGARGPESSRRARALSVWATLRAYGRKGHREMVEQHLDLAQRMGERVDGKPELERLADVTLNIVCFRFNPGGKTEEELNALNERLGKAILDDGRFFAGTTLFEGKVALRPAISNWRTEAHDVDEFVDVVAELGREVLGTE